MIVAAIDAAHAGGVQRFPLLVVVVGIADGEAERANRFGWARVGEGERGNHAAAFGSLTRLAFANSDSFSIRQCGIELEVFQLETVEGGTPKASATATVPPRSTMNCEMLSITIVLRKP